MAIVNLQCANCQAPVEFEVDATRILHIPKTIIIAIEHRGLVACPQCASMLALKVLRLDGMALGTIVAPDPTRSIIPAGGSIIKLPKN